MAYSQLPLQVDMGLCEAKNGETWGNGETGRREDLANTTSKDNAGETQAGRSSPPEPSTRGPLMLFE